MNTVSEEASVWHTVISRCLKFGASFSSYMGHRILVALKMIVFHCRLSGKWFDLSKKATAKLKDARYALWAFVHLPNQQFPLPRSVELHKTLKPCSTVLICNIWFLVSEREILSSGKPFIKSKVIVFQHHLGKAWFFTRKLNHWPSKL